MSDTAIVGIVGIVGTVGTLVGVFLGGFLEVGQADRALRREAYQDYAALQRERLSAIHQFRENVERGRPNPTPPLRADLEREWYRTVSLVELVARPGLIGPLGVVNDRFRDLLDAMDADPASTAETQAATFAALKAFTAAASADLVPWWEHIRRRYRA